MRRILGVAIALLVVLAVGLLWGRIDVDALHAEAERLNGFAVFLGLTFLPMIGFPVSILHVIAGARFGTAGGLAVVSASIVVQLFASYALVRALPGFFERRLEPLRRRLPAGAHRSVTLFTLFLPGAPYFAQNYVLPLIGVPLSTYLIWGIPVHVVRSIVGIAFGDVSDNLTWGRIAWFVLYGVVITLVCAWAFRSLRSQLQARRPAADDPTLPASARYAER